MINVLRTIFSATLRIIGGILYLAFQPEMIEQVEQSAKRRRREYAFRESDFDQRLNPNKRNTNWHGW